MWLRPALVPERLRARRRIGDLRGVVADAGRPPHVRDGVRVARVVARDRPTRRRGSRCSAGATCRASSRAPRSMKAGMSTEIGKRHVVAATVVAELGVRLVGVGEEVVRHLDPVLLLEVTGRRPRRCSRSSCRRTARPRGTGRASVRGAASLGGAAEPVGGGGALAALGDAVAPPPVQAATIGASAVTAPTLAIRSRSIRRVSLCSTM